MALTAHAHVERALLPKREAALGFIDLHGRNTNVEDDAVEACDALRACDAFELGKARLDQRQPAARGVDKVKARRDRAGIAIERQNFRVRGREDGGGITTGTEGRVEIEATGFRRQGFEDLHTKHGNVTGQSASGDVLKIAAARIHSRAPRGGGPSGAEDWEPNCFRKMRDRALASSKCA